MIRRPSAVGGTSGIEQQDAVPAVTNGLVAVTIDQTIESLSLEFSENTFFKFIGTAPSMDQADAETACFDDLADGNPPYGRIHVPAHRVNGPTGKSEQHIRIHHVAGMKDHVDVTETSVQQVLKQGQPLPGIMEMGIGKHADS